jgi:hypothetical protein
VTITPTPEQLAQLQQLAQATGVDPDLVAMLAGNAGSVPDDQLMALLAQEVVLPDDVVHGSFDELLAQLDPRWERLVRFAATHLADRIPGQGEMVPKMLLEWALAMLTGQLASDPEGSRDDLVLLIRQAATDLEITPREVFGEGDVIDLAPRAHDVDVTVEEDNYRGQ